MSYVIRYMGLAGPAVEYEPAEVGDYLKFYDPDGGDPDHPVTGVVEWTSDPDEALRFASALLAMQCWRQQSTRRPFRGDGKPNRPLAAVTVEIGEL